MDVAALLALAAHLYRPMKTGMVARVGRQPASGFTPASLYRRAVSSCRFSWSLAYLPWQGGRLA
jgi:hypothetical protein